MSGHVPKINLGTSSSEQTDENRMEAPGISKPVKTRKRGFSFRIQVSPQKQEPETGRSRASSIRSIRSTQSLLPHRKNHGSSSSSSMSKSGVDASSIAQALKSSQPGGSKLEKGENIELRKVDQTYSPGNWSGFRTANESNEDDTRSSSGAQTSSDSMTCSNSGSWTNNKRDNGGGKFGFLNSHMINNSTMNLDREPNYILKAAEKPVKKLQLIRKIDFLHHLINLLLGRSEDLPSLGGRKIPITVNMGRIATEFPTTRDRHGNYQLIDERKGSPYLNNTITSSKYTVFSFLPRQLLAQFSKLANCYFFIVAIMQLVPSWSTTGTTTTIIPLAIFMSISIAREGWDDIRRHRLDKLENDHRTSIVSEGTNDASIKPYKDTMAARASRSMSANRDDAPSFSDESDHDSLTVNTFMNEDLMADEGLFVKSTRWRDIKVGQIVKLSCNEWVPADIVLLTSNNPLGETFVETMALDGETNLKSRMPSTELHNLANNAKSLYGLQATVRSEDPNLDLYNFEGSLDLTDSVTHESKKFPLGPDSVIYRGSIIRNTKSCLGLVIFTGEETKIRMNAIKRPRIKAPKIQKTINHIVLFMVLVVVCLSAFSMMGERLLYHDYRLKNWYIYQEDAGVAATLMGYIIMLNTLIPLSLYVTTEIIKVMQLILLQWDIDMYDPDSNTPAEARTATILEELGQVSYIFSDKTGTLTDNMMLFRKFSIGGAAWVHDVNERLQREAESKDDSDSDSAGRDETDDTLFRPPKALSKLRSTSPRQSEEIMGRGSVTFAGCPSMASLTKANMKKPRALPTRKSSTDSTKSHGSTSMKLKSSVDLIQYIQTRPQTLYARKAKMFLLSMALCHTCLPKKVDEDSEQTSSEPEYESNDDDSAIEYQASSPDELALVQAASDMGFVLFSRKRDKVTLKLYPNGFDEDPVYEEYEILDVIDFSSSRKRMSVIVRFPDRRIHVLCKGADNVIMERLKAKHIAETKKEQLSKTISERKQMEADLVLSNRSMDAGSVVAGRASGMSNSRVSGMSFAPPSAFVGSGPKLSISSLTDNDNENRDVQQVLEQSRRSITMQQRQKFKESNYIPSDKLLVNEEFVIERTLQHVDEFSSDGLRTLLYAYKTVTEADFESWEAKYSAAKMAVKDRSKKVEEAGGEIEESGFSLLGCTAIEDKLQAGVPETIEKLRRAGLKMWMLTGDKRETAINIGYSCKLIKDYSKVVVLSIEQNSISELSSLMNAAEIELDEGNVAHCVVVIDGVTLTAIEEDVTIMSVFVSLGVKADSVICCRASPSQKASLVGRVRNLKKGEVTLAIGDGANDIAMIQNADVGVGITGKEGLQAARVSDYSIARFKFLQKLLFVHGRYNYVRTSKFVLCTFYKELMFYLTQFLYQRYTLYTGSSLYEPWSLSMYNTLFTSLTVMFVGMFDMDLRPATLIAVPELYAIGREGKAFSLKVFLQWICLSASQSVTLFFTMIYIYGFNATMDNTTYPLGNVIYTAIVFLVSTKCCLIETHNISKVPAIAWFVSVSAWLVWLLLLVGLNQNRLQKIFYVKYGLLDHFGRDSTFWASILALIFVGLFMDVIYHFLHGWLHPTDTDIFQQLEQLPEVREKLELLSYGSLKQGWCWLHEGQIERNAMKSWPKSRRVAHEVSSFMRKGSAHTSKATRKRRDMMVDPKKTLSQSPRIVTIRDAERYNDVMLPSGKIVRIRKRHKDPYGGGDTLGSRRPRSRSRITGMFTRSKNKNSIIEETGDVNIDEVLERRMKNLEEQ